MPESLSTRSLLSRFASENALTEEQLHLAIRQNAAAALEEDLSSTGDATAALIAPDKVMRAVVIAREEAVLAGQPWAQACLAHWQSASPPIKVQWLVQEGQRCVPNQPVLELQGPAQALLSAERSVLNFLQMQSAVASKTAQYVAKAAGSKARIVDTRKTLPGLRLAQKYAVFVGGGLNHRIGLFDAVLIKENHIASAGGVAQALAAVASLGRALRFVEIEVETLTQLEQALSCGAKMVLLDNMDTATIAEAVRITKGQAVLETSGGVTLEQIPTLAATGVDRISIGSLTKDVKAIDFSMRFYPI